MAPPHYTYYEMQLGGPDAAAHMQQRQQMQVNNFLQMSIYVLTILIYGKQIFKNVDF